MTARILAEMAKPRGRFPHARRAGDFLFISGTSSRQPDGSFAGAEVTADGSIKFDLRKQTEAVLASIRKILAAEGGSFADLVEVNAFLTDMNQFETFNQVYGEHFDYDGPTRTTIGVRALPHPFMLIEIKAVAYLPNRPK
jgi:2-aminomuconate deaminase